MRNIVRSYNNRATSTYATLYELSHASSITMQSTATQTIDTDYIASALNTADKIEIILMTIRNLTEAIKNPSKLTSVGIGTHLTSADRDKHRTDLALDINTCAEVLAYHTRFHKGLYEVFTIAAEVKAYQLDDNAQQQAPAR